MKLVTDGTLAYVQTLKYGPLGLRWWGPALRDRFDYVPPGDIYEAVVCDHVAADTVWLDVGCGRNIFPWNKKLAQVLADRCKRVVGIDPDDNIDDNMFVHERHKCVLEDFETDTRFDLITLRMVAEHITQPKETVAKLASLIPPNGHVIVYTIWKWAPVSLVAYFTPTSFHRFVKRIVWGSESRDTFPIAYKMNTRRELSELFETRGFREVQFQYLDDACMFKNSKFLNTIELYVWRALRGLKMSYPERTILAIYQRT